MPNGDPNFDVEDMELFFAPIADAVHEFAKRRNLLVDKYYHDSWVWSLRFNHPKGGQASMQLRRDDVNHLLLSSVWYYDDYERFTRYLDSRQEHEVPCEPVALGYALETELKNIVAEEFGNWNQVAGGYENNWGRHPKEEFVRMAPKLPVPTLGNWTP